MDHCVFVLIIRKERKEKELPYVKEKKKANIIRKERERATICQREKESKYNKKGKRKKKQ